MKTEIFLNNRTETRPNFYKIFALKTTSIYFEYELCKHHPSPHSNQFLFFLRNGQLLLKLELNVETLKVPPISGKNFIYNAPFTVTRQPGSLSRQLLSDPMHFLIAIALFYEPRQGQVRKFLRYKMLPVVSGSQRSSSFAGAVPRQKGIDSFVCRLSFASWVQVKSDWINFKQGNLGMSTVVQIIAKQLRLKQNQA